MQGCFPFRMCLECVQGPSFSATQSYAHLRDEVQPVKLDTSHAGSEVVLLKNGTRICGVGGALATAPIVQNKAFFQVCIQQSGVWAIGVGNRFTELSNLSAATSNAWLLRSDGTLSAENGEMVGRVDEPLHEGDIIGVAFDHVELKFFKAGEQIGCITSLKNTSPMYPLVFVDDNAILDAKFRCFDVTPPAGYEEIMIEQTLL